MLINKSITENSISMLAFTPSALELFIETISSVHMALPPSLRTLFVGGEKLTNKVVQKVRAANPQNRLQIVNIYGPTEATIQCATHFCTDTESLSAIPVGTPVAHTQLYVLDHCGHPLPTGIPGE
ncbi:AMP-binding protein, partial [Sansalvadorimonas verongulae]|uniref:AMP-binding protein n=1 Tax=Sansalvadorimonas verongulae TaxID=2172824 RepID=UPI0038B45A9D